MFSMPNEMVFLNDPIWYSPLNVISHFKRIEKELSISEHTSKKFRKAREAFEVAVMLVGMRLILNREFWLQLVGDELESPDVRTGTFTLPTKTKADDFSIQDVEVVEYNNHSRETLIDFLKRTKLSNKKSYDPLTTILCYINRNMYCPPLRDLHNDLRKEGIKGINCPIILVGKTLPEKETYKIAQINPSVDLIAEFDLIKELKDKKYKGVLSLLRGTTPKFDYCRNEKHLPFEKIDLE